MHTAHTPALPFSGLGFSLHSVHERARSLTLSWCYGSVADEPLPGILRNVTYSVSGYALLLSLSRETRGR